jgi:dolichyl-phosphate-mannose--protein O-mannosyl transferase
MYYTKDNIVKDKAKTWKSFNKLTIYTIVYVCIVPIVIFNLF